MNSVSRNRRFPRRVRLRPSSWSQPPSTTHETSTTLRTVAMRARSVRRLMERATIHSDVGGINGLRAPDLLPSVHLAEALRGDTTWHDARNQTRLRPSWQAERQRDRIICDVGLVARCSGKADGLLLDALFDRLHGSSVAFADIAELDRRTRHRSELVLDRNHD